MITHLCIFNQHSCPAGSGPVPVWPLASSSSSSDNIDHNRLVNAKYSITAAIEPYKRLNPFHQVTITYDIQFQISQMNPKRICTYIEMIESNEMPISRPTIGDSKQLLNAISTSTSILCIRINDLRECY